MRSKRVISKSWGANEAKITVATELPIQGIRLSFQTSGQPDWLSTLNLARKPSRYIWMATAYDASGSICMSRTQLAANWSKCIGDHALSASIYQTPTGDSPITKLDEPFTFFGSKKTCLSHHTGQTTEALHHKLVDTLFCNATVI
ncbi:MAG: hypothetical protein NZM04_10845 [Methylacidiphilales bacterium]|nr:hypothetical protein [Candidatus Methylacidiphilales bacterium]